MTDNSFDTSAAARIPPGLQSLTGEPLTWQNVAYTLPKGWVVADGSEPVINAKLTGDTVLCITFPDRNSISSLDASKEITVHGTLTVLVYSLSQKLKSVNLVIGDGEPNLQLIVTPMSRALFGRGVWQHILPPNLLELVPYPAVQ